MNHIQIKSKTYEFTLDEGNIEDYDFQEWGKLVDGVYCLHREGDLPAYIDAICYRAWVLNDQCYSYSFSYSDERHESNSSIDPKE